MASNLLTTHCVCVNSVKSEFLCSNLSYTDNKKMSKHLMDYYWWSLSVNVWLCWAKPWYICISTNVSVESVACVQAFDPIWLCCVGVALPCDQNVQSDQCDGCKVHDYLGDHNLWQERPENKWNNNHLISTPHTIKSIVFKQNITINLPAEHRGLEPTHLSWLEHGLHQTWIHP